MFREYPYLNLQDLNLDYILRKIREMQTELNNFVVTNAIKYADPIDWNITTQYEKNTVVIDANSGIAYLSVQPVPSGVAITNTDYWTVIFDLSMFIDKNAKNLTSRVEGQTNTATFNSVVDDWLIWYDELYIVINNINAGDAYIVNSNIRRFTIEEVIDALNNVIGELDNLITSDKTNVVSAINEVVGNVGDLNTLATTDKSSVVGALNEVLNDIDIANADALLKAAPFIANREGSTVRGYQSCIKTYSGYLLSYETPTGFSIDHISLTDFSVINTYNYNVAAHPNAMFANANYEYIFVVDSTNHVVIKLDNALSIVGTITDYQNLNIISGNTDENDNMYLYGDAVYKFDGDNITETINLDLLNLPSSAIIQGIFVYNNVIYQVINRPNSLAFYNMEGELLGFKELPLGDGFYPLGEVEFFTVYNNTVSLLTACYTIRRDTNDVVMFSQIFDTNISTPLSSNAKFGQAYPESSTLNIDGTAPKSKNPDGSISYPFTNGYELSCVYTYLYSEYAYKGFIHLNGDSDIILIYNSEATIDNSTHKTLNLLQILNSTVNISELTITNMMVYGSDITTNNCIVTDSLLYHSDIHGYKTTIATCSSIYSKITGNIDITTITPTKSDIIRYDGQVNDHIASTLRTFSTGSYLKTLLKDSVPTTIEITAFYTGSPVGNTTIRMSLGVGDKTSLAGGTNITRTILIPLVIGTKYAFVSIDITITSNYDIAGKINGAMNLDGTTASITNLYLTTLTVTNCLTHI